MGTQVRTYSSDVIFIRDHSLAAHKSSCCLRLIPLRCLTCVRGGCVCGGGGSHWGPCLHDVILHIPSLPRCHLRCSSLIVQEPLIVIFRALTSFCLYHAEAFFNHKKSARRQHRHCTRTFALPTLTLRLSSLSATKHIPPGRERERRGAAAPSLFMRLNKCAASRATPSTRRRN